MREIQPSPFALRDNRICCSHISADCTRWIELSNIYSLLMQLGKKRLRFLFNVIFWFNVNALAWVEGRCKSCRNFECVSVSNDDTCWSCASGQRLQFYPINIGLQEAARAISKVWKSMPYTATEDSIELRKMIPELNFVARLLALKMTGSWSFNYKPYEESLCHAHSIGDKYKLLDPLLS